MSQPRKGAEIREAFLGFYEARGHSRQPSDLLVPTNDPTLLFTGAGMNQFKDEFLGKGKRGLQRATTAQKCLRVPDLENVGKTPRHHTFFEMLGNFSFGDYFKKETIPWEWEFFTEVLGWDAGRFVVTVYKDDDEAFDLWHDGVGLPPERIYRFGEKENFWPASAPSKGPNGVCGPCSEIYFDLEPDSGPLPGNEGMDELPERFLEVGNFVFTQFDRKDGGVLEPLPQKNIDVGLGLERIAAVAQDATNNFETDIFAPLLEAIQSQSGKRYGADEQDDVRMRRIADHARAVFFCIADGAAPGRDGRGYVVRKILRRAIRDGIDLGLSKPFLSDLLPAVQQSMGAAYPELNEQGSTIQSMAHAEEERFRDVYRQGIARLETLVGEVRKQRGATLFPGALAFELHDTYGFPSDITEVIVRDHGLELDEAGFELAMEQQRERARTGSALSGDVFAASLSAGFRAAGHEATEFLGYHEDSATAKVLALLTKEGPVDSLDTGVEGQVLLDRSPFYAEGGGQVGDCGMLEDASGGSLFEVLATTSEDGFTLHAGKSTGSLKVGDSVIASVDTAARRATEAHHTGTHLLHAALKAVVGAHVNQAGSLVAPDRLRFDYTHNERLSPEQLREIETLVNREVLRAQSVGQRMSSLEQAKADGVVALFGEKYGNEVRVVEVPGFSQELCGGTHVQNTGAIGPFIIVSDRALAAGVRRIEALAGLAALAVLQQNRASLASLAQDLKTPPEKLGERVKQLRADLKAAKSRKASAAPDAKTLGAELQALAEAETERPRFAAKILPGIDAGSLRQLASGLQKVKGLPEVVLLLGVEEGNVSFIFLCDPAGGPKAGDLAKRFGPMIQGGGGGRPDFAQGKGARSDGVEDAVAELKASLAAHA